MPVSIVANDLTIHSRSGPLSLVDINASGDTTSPSHLASIVCVLADSREQHRFRSIFKRDRRAENPTTTWTLESGNTPLPCSALAECFPVLELLGADATYAGVMTYSQQPEGGATLDLGASTFCQVELSRLFEKLPHKLTGKSQLELNRCLIGTDGKAIDVRGSIFARDGLVGGGLLDASRKHLRLAIPMLDPSSPIRELEYDRIAFGFDIHDEVMKLTGICGQRSGERIPAARHDHLCRRPTVGLHI